MAAACATAALGDVVLLVVGDSAVAPGHVPVIATAAAVASLLRFTLSQRVARRDLIG